MKFIMIDPKRVELTLYNKTPHLLTPVITDAKKTILALNQGLTYQETAKLLLLAPKYGLKCLEAQRSG